MTSCVWRSLAKPVASRLRLYVFHLARIKKTNILSSPNTHTKLFSSGGMYHAQILYGWFNQYKEGFIYHYLFDS